MPEAATSPHPFFAALDRSIHSPLHSPLGIPILHKVRPGETVSGIIQDYYDASYGSASYRQAEATILVLNPSLASPHQIRSGQILRLMPIPYEARHCPVEADLDYHTAMDNSLSRGRLPVATSMDMHIPPNPVARDLFCALTWMEQNYSWFSQPTGVGLASLELITGPGNAALVQQVGTAYEQYRSGRLTKGQYDYRRRQLLQKFTQQAGPMERLLLKGQNATEAVRISRIRGFPATHKVESVASRLTQLSRAANGGGIILAGAGLYMGCRQIAAAQNRQEKNEIMVETLASTTFGAGAGLAIAAMIAATPVGWGLALVLATGTALASAGVGKGFRRLYDQSFQEYDLVNMTGLERICK